MKKYSFIILIIVLFTIFSCKDEISDAYCKTFLEDINDIYDEEINVVKNNPDLTQEQKDSEIALLNEQREAELAAEQAWCDDQLEL